MKTRLLIIFALASFALLSFAQCDEFVVYQTKGDVKLLHGSASQAAQKNMKLGADSKLSLGQEAMVILLSGKDKALRLNSPGKYSIQDIRSVCMKNQSSLTKEYVNYVAKSILEKSEPLTAQVIKGAVYRSKTEFEKTAMILPADSSVITSASLTFTWHVESFDSPVYLLIYENGVKEVCSKMLSDTTITLDAGMFKPDLIYFWLVSSSPTPSDKEVRFTFLIGEPDWQDKAVQEWSATMKELQGQMDTTREKMNKKKKP